MFRSASPWRAHARRFCASVSASVLVVAAPSFAADREPQARVPGLQALFDAAWARQPEAQAARLRREALLARREAAESWTVEPPALELSTKTEQLNRDRGGREQAIGIAIPLWLPGERDRAAALADADAQASEARLASARLRIAALVRDAYWNWQRARVEQALAQDRLASARALASDVARRVEAGDLARADRHQADGNAAAAEGDSALARAQATAAFHQVRALVGDAVAPGGEHVADYGGVATEVDPLVARFDPLPAHAEVRDALAQGEAARRAAELARVQTRANPEIAVSTARERGSFGDAYAQSMTFGLRFPFGSEPRNRARMAAAGAEALEAEGRARIARERIAAEIEAARARSGAAREVAAAAERRAQLAREARGFFDRSFRAGETDLPTRLRIEREAVEAERLAARARIDHAAAVSALRQALGLMPEETRP